MHCYINYMYFPEKYMKWRLLLLSYVFHCLYHVDDSCISLIHRIHLGLSHGALNCVVSFNPRETVSDVWGIIKKQVVFWSVGPLAIYVKLRVAHAPGMPRMPERFHRHQRSWWRGNIPGIPGACATTIYVSVKGTCEIVKLRNITSVLPILCLCHSKHVSDHMAQRLFHLKVHLNSRHNRHYYYTVFGVYTANSTRWCHNQAPFVHSLRLVKSYGTGYIDSD